MRTLAAGTELAPTLVASRTALPPKGTTVPAASEVNPHACRFAYCTAPRGGRCACGPAKPVPWPWLAWNPIVSPYVNSRPAPRSRLSHAGFTLIELLVVVAIIGIASTGVGLALRDTSGTALEREAQRLAVLLDSARAQSRMTANPVRWRPTPTGFVFEGLTTASAFPTTWLGQDVRAAVTSSVVLGPEPVIGPQQIRLVSTLDPSRSLVLATDGIRPFAVMAEGAR